MTDNWLTASGRHRRVARALVREANYTVTAQRRAPAKPFEHPQAATPALLQQTTPPVQYCRSIHQHGWYTTPVAHITATHTAESHTTHTSVARLQWLKKSGVNVPQLCTTRERGALGTMKRHSHPGTSARRVLLSRTRATSPGIAILVRYHINVGLQCSWHAHVANCGPSTPGFLANRKRSISGQHTRANTRHSPASHTTAQSWLLSARIRFDLLQRQPLPRVLPPERCTRVCIAANTGDR